MNSRTYIFWKEERLMAEKKITLRVDATIYEPFKAICQANNFTVGEVITVGIEDCDSIVNMAIAKREKEIREAKEAQILKLQQELGYTEAEMKKLLKNSKPSVEKPAKTEEESLESRQAHKGTYEGEDVMWEVDRYTSGYFCHTSDGKTHKKDVYGNIVS